MRNSKKILALALGAVMTVSICGCSSSGSSTKASSKAISAGIRALELADSYLDNKARYSKISDELDSLSDSLSYADPSVDDSPETKADFSIQLAILSIDTKIMLDDMDSTAKTYEDVLKARNNLAEEIGEKTRE